MADPVVTIVEPTPTPAPTPTTTTDPSTPQRDPQGNLLEPGQTPSLPTTPSPPTSAPAPTSTEPKTSAKTDGPPEAYAAFTAPDGYTIDAKTIEAATPIFKEMGLTQANAQKLVDFHTQQMIAAAKAPESEYEATRADWVAKAKADPDMAKAVDPKSGKTGLEAVKIEMSRALSAIGDEALVADFKAAMNTTGVGDNPAFIKTFWKMASFVTEGKHVSGAGPSVHGQVAPGASSVPSAAKAMYPNLP